MDPSKAVSGSLSRHVAQFVAFRIDNQSYAFRIEQIQEIVILDQVTKTPQVPSFVEGVANLRGSIIPVSPYEYSLVLSQNPSMLTLAPLLSTWGLEQSDAPLTRFCR
jgi:chemotaxis signal transduction protein